MKPTAVTISAFSLEGAVSNGLLVSEANLRQIRVLHIVSAGGVANSLQPSLFMPLLTRLPRQRVKAQVACLSPGAVPSAVLRQNGVPTFDLALSRKRFSPGAFGELVQSARHFRPDVIQAWGHTAQVISAMLRKRCDWKPRLVWSLADTTPLVKNAGFLDRQKLKYVTRFASRADRIVYTSEAAAAQHRRVGFPDGGHETVPPGVDATRFKPDFAARRKLREELKLPGETFVIGMVAPFQPEFDHATFLKAIGELVKLNPNVAVVLAGHGVQKGNAPLMALVGGGALATRVHLLGEWSDVNGLYNACDIVCSSAVNDHSRMNIVMAMLCGVPCVATGIGAQGEVIGQHGVAIEPGNPAAFVKGITRVMQLSPEKRTHMAQGARKHALANYVYVRSLQKYLQLYYDLIGRQSLVTKDLPTPEIDASLTVPPALPSEAEMNASKRKPITVVDLSDPDSLESKVAERAPEELPKWRIEQEEERKKREAELAAQVADSKSVGDVLQVFESEQAKAASSESPMTERARGVADDSEELLSPELLAAEVPLTPRVSHGPSSSRKAASSAPAPSVSAQDAAKQAALKAARMAALQPIAPPSRPVAAPKASSAVTKPPVTKPASPLTRPPATSPVTRPPATSPVARTAETSPATRPPATSSVAQSAETSPATRPPATSPVARTAETSPATRPPATSAVAQPAETSPATRPPATSHVAQPAASTPVARPLASGAGADTRPPATQPEIAPALDIMALHAETSTSAGTPETSQPAANIPAAVFDVTRPSAITAAGGSESPKSAADTAASVSDVTKHGAIAASVLNDAAKSADVPNVSSTAAAETKTAQVDADPLEMLPEFPLFPPVELDAPTVTATKAEEPVVDLGGTQPLEMLPEITLLSPLESNIPTAPAVVEPAQTDAGGTELPEMLPEIALFLDPKAAAAIEPAKQDLAEQKPETPTEDLSSSTASERAKVDLPQGLASLEPSDSAGQAESKAAASGEEKKVGFDSPQPMGMFSQALANATLRLAAFTARATDTSKAEPSEQPAEVTPKVAPEQSAIEKSAPKNVEPTAAQEKSTSSAVATSNQDFGELALMATGQWMTMQWPGVKSEPDQEKADELSGAEALSLISTPASDTKSEASGDPTVKLAHLPDPAVEPKRAANGK